jgi:hypothetical protein
MLKNYSNIFAFAIFSFSLTYCNAQNTAPEITLDQENASLARVSIQTDTVEQQTQEPKQSQTEKQSAAPFTITVKQIGEPSVKTFYKIPVEITITNNLDNTLCLVPPYFGDASFSTTDIQSVCNDMFTIEKGLASLIFIALVAGASIDLGMKLTAWLYPDTIEYSESPEGIKICMYGMTSAADKTEAFKTVLKFCVKWGLILQPVILTAKIINTARNRGAKMAYAITPHETRTIKGYLSKTDMKLVQDGKLTSIFTTTNSFTNTTKN